jgi:uncharacterized protein YdhG (YjbR/CyaY superfamily)
MKKPESESKDNQQVPAKEIDDYLARVPKEARAALEKLRQIIKSAAPRATETISYQIPTFRHLGGLVSYAAFKNHCSLFPMSLRVMATFREDLKEYDCAKGTINFTPEKPLSAALIRKIIKARLVENAAKQKARKSK